MSGNSVHKGSIVVFRDLKITVNSDFDGLLGGIEGTVTSLTLVRGVRVLVFRSQTEELDVVVSQFRDGTIATTLTTTLVRVLDTRN